MNQSKPGTGFTGDLQTKLQANYQKKTKPQRTKIIWREKATRRQKGKISPFHSVFSHDTQENQITGLVRL